MGAFAGKRGGPRDPYTYTGPGGMGPLQGDGGPRLGGGGRGGSEFRFFLKPGLGKKNEKTLDDVGVWGV